jgi:hypothetical protein
VTGPAGLPGVAEREVRTYLAEIATRLTGPAQARRDILAELDGGLADAACAYRADGMSPAQAARAAIAEFGRPDQVAAGFRAELSTAQARRTAFILMATGPAIGVLWAAAALASGIGAHDAAPWRWTGWPAGDRLAIHLAVIVLVAVIGSILFTLAATGSLTRWLPARPATSAAVAATGIAAVDVTLLALLAALAATTPGRLAALPAGAAAAASLARLTFAGRAARSCLTNRAACPRVGG